MAVPEQHSRQHNATINVTAQTYTSATEGRTAVFQFCSTDPAYNYQQNITATQNAATPTISVSPSSLTFNASASSQQVFVTANFDYSIDIRSTVSEWVTVTPSSDKKSLTISVKENLTEASRSGSGGITLIEPNEKITSASISVTQAAPATPIGDPQSLNFTNKGGAYSLAITTDVAWTATTSISESWLQVSPTEGPAGKTTLTVQATPNGSVNERNGFIYINIGGTQRLSIAVKQEGYYFHVTPTTTPTFTSKGGTHKFSIATNNDESWTAKSADTSWLTLSETSGTGNIDVTLTASDNPSIKSRESTVTFTPDHMEPVEFKVTQAARYLRLSHASISFTNKEANETVTVETDATYTITSSDPSWLTIQQTGNTFIVKATENTTGVDRKANIVVAMTGLKAGEEYAITLPVTQRAFQSGVNIQPFGDDEQWELNTVDGITITVTGFTEDENWD